MLTEEQEQVIVVQHLVKNNILHYHIANQRMCSISYKVRLKKLGVSSGVPDICIPVARSSFHGLYIELKSTKGKVSPSQLEWISNLTVNGYKALVCYGHLDAIKEIDNYLEIPSYINLKTT